MRKLSLILLTLLFLVPTFARSPTEAATPDSMVLKLVGQVGGPTQAVAVRGNYAYVAVGLRLMVLDLSNPRALREIGATHPFEGFVEGVAIVENIVYASCGGAGLYLVDVSNPAHPTQVGVYDSPGYAEGVAVVGRYAYVADGWAGLWVVDISDRAYPVEVGFVRTLGYAFDVAVAGDYAYVAGAGAGLRVVNISVPQHPCEVGSYDTPGYAHDVAIAGDTVYIADKWEGLRVVDISEPTRPRELGFYATPGQAFGVAVVDSKVYVADAFAGLRVVDVSNPATPIEVGGYEVRGHAGQVAVAGGIAYVADRNWGLRAMDVSDPVHPTQVGFYGPPGYARDVTVAGGYAYVAAGYYGLRVVDVSAASHPTQVGVYSTTGYAISVALAGKYAYVAAMSPGLEGAGGLHVVDISDPTHPSRIGFYERTGLGAYRDMAVAGEIAYMANEMGLELISLTDPMHLTRLGFIELCDPTFPARGSCTVGVAVSGNFAYVAVEQAGLKIVDISVPSDPKLIGVCDLHFSQNVALAGDYAYAADGGHGLEVVDIHEPTHPALAGSYDTSGDAYGIAVSGDIAYVADAGAGLQVIDVSVPSTPTLVGSYNTPGFAHQVAVVGSHAYVADCDGGMLILKIASDSGMDRTTSNARLEIPEKSPKTTSQVPAQFSLYLGSMETKSIYLVIPGQGGSSNGYWSDESRSVACPIRPQPDGPALYSTGGTLTVISAGDSSSGSLRWCLENAVKGDTIAFDSSVFPPGNPVTITLSKELPAITQGGLTVDASDAGVILDGSNLTKGWHDGLLIVSDGNVIKGLQILNFSGAGVVIRDGAKYNVIGGNRERGSGLTGEGNLISGNGWVGIDIRGVGTMGNIVIGNLIGTDISGKETLSNQGAGVFIANGASYNRIGGTDLGERNIISGNGAEGINIMGAEVSGNIVIGNYIGTDASGMADLGNEGSGVAIQCGAFDNLVKGNLISANKRGGVRISDWGSSYNTVIGNLVGTDASGTLALGNDWCGVFVGFMGASFNRIGGTSVEEKNVISGNERGVDLCGSGDVGNLIIGNYIGMDISGTRAIGNAHDGISVSGTSERVFIGGMTEGERNVISGNGNGISLDNDYNWVAGNYIGTDASGIVALGNNGLGVSIDGAKHNTVQANVISGNKQCGIRIKDAGDNIIFHNNFIDNEQGNGYDNVGTNFWDHRGDGNYWSDYQGKDANGDGIGDTPYEIPGGTGAKDDYPLIAPTWNHPPDQPSNVSPSDNATGVDLTPMLESSPFSDPDVGDNHAASQWQITTTVGDHSSPIFDSGTDNSNLTSIAIPSKTLSYNTTYYWRVRHQDNNGAWSSYSEETSFHTETEAAPPAGEEGFPWLWVVVGIGVAILLAAGIVLGHRLTRG